MRKKSDLPTKICVVCGRPFAWRKKWARDWEAVTVCSERCRRAKRAGAEGVRGGGGLETRELDVVVRGAKARY